MTDDSAPFTLYWHRYGNSLAQLDAVAALRGSRGELAGRPLVHGVELDLKWTPDDQGAPLLYAYHGPTGRELLDQAGVRRRAQADEVALIEDVLARPDAGDCAYLVEVKCGHGPIDAALAALARLVEGRDLTARVVIAASSLDLLGAAARTAPGLRRTLFGSMWGRDRLLHRPTTYTLRSLWRHGFAPRVGGHAVDEISNLGLQPKPTARHEVLAKRARARGLDYLPGRVDTWASLGELAAGGFSGAFVYMRPEDA